MINKTANHSYSFFSFFSVGITFLFSFHILFSFFFGLNYELGNAYDYTRFLTFFLLTLCISFLTFTLKQNDISFSYIYDSKEVKRDKIIKYNVIPGAFIYVKSIIYKDQ